MNATLFLDEEIKQFEIEVKHKSVENQKKLRTIVENITYETITKELSLDQAETYCCYVFKYYESLKP